MTIKISASILSADFSKLGEEISLLDKTNVDMIHFDIMDGVFVPNITFGASMVRALRNFSPKVFDVHLMIENPQNYIEEFAKSGADIITVHQEASVHLDRTINKIKEFKVRAGVSIVPSSPVSAIEYILENVDLVLVMSVNPGFGGQKFITRQLKKIEELANIVSKNNYSLEIEVDGGINHDNAKLCADAGANILVAGNYIFSSENHNYQARIDSLKKW